jgi:hypothetical protein
MYKAEFEVATLENTMTVKEFADATSRFPNQIYDFINKGNQFRKLAADKIDGKTRVFTSELAEYPFTAADKFRIDQLKKYFELEKRMRVIEQELRELESVVEQLSGNRVTP